MDDVAREKSAGSQKLRLHYTISSQICQPFLRISPKRLLHPHPMPWGESGKHLDKTGDSGYNDGRAPLHVRRAEDVEKISVMISCGEFLEVTGSIFADRKEATAMNRRVFLIVLDSFGIGEMPDAHKWQDEGSNTLAAVRSHPAFCCPNLARLGLFHIDGVAPAEPSADDEPPIAVCARMTEASNGKDTTIGHWEIAGLISERPLPTYPEGFPPEVLEEFTRRTGYGVLCNQTYSGTDVIRDYGEEHLNSGKLIVYTSADSVFQIAAHERVVSVEELYRICEIARDMLTTAWEGRHAVGRVIARPFTGEYPFRRAPLRHDYSIEPPAPTMLDALRQAGLDTIAVGKIHDIFVGKGITESIRTTCNAEGMAKAAALAERDFHGLCFVNLVDFDMMYGHRNDVAGYAAALTEFDRWLGAFLPTLREEDLLIITADHGCDPATPSTDHSREYTPLLMYRKGITPKNLGTRQSFADIAATVLAYLQVEADGLAGSPLE